MATEAPTKTEEEKDFDEGKEEDTKILSHDKVAETDSSTATMTSNTTAKDDGEEEEEEEEEKGKETEGSSSSAWNSVKVYSEVVRKTQKKPRWEV